MIFLIVNRHTNPNDYLRFAVRIKCDQYAVADHLVLFRVRISITIFAYVHTQNTLLYLQLFSGVILS